MTEFDRSQYCEPDIDVDVEAAFDSEEKAKQYINDTLVAELIEEERNRTCISSEWEGVGITCNNICQDNVCFTQIPDYPDQLCYDGKMYAVCYGFPILTDYTVMADRTWFDIRSVSCFIGKRNRSGDNLGAFEFEFRANQALSFGRTNSIIFADSGIVYQTKNSYNGIGIESGLLDDTDVLIIGAAQQNINNKPQDIYIGCHGDIIIADRSFTEEEINWLKENIYNIEI
jgi:hypothetical protein